MNSKTRRALLNVSDRTGIVELAHGLKELGFEVLAGGATAKALKQYELEISEVPNLRGVRGLLEPKTRYLHPSFFGALLADKTKPEEVRAANTLGQSPIDLVALNLYPLAQVLEQDSLTQSEAMEFIDIAASALLRAAARTHAQTIVLCDPVDYVPTVEALREFGDVTLEERRNLAAKAFHYTAYYDSMIAKLIWPSATICSPTVARAAARP